MTNDPLVLHQRHVRSRDAFVTRPTMIKRRRGFTSRAFHARGEQAWKELAIAAVVTTVRRLLFLTTR
jgi:hypothetical protein